MRRSLTFLLIVASIQGCATPYQHSGFSGGYSETQLNENVFTVIFRGNGYTSEEKASDFMLLRSAELTLQNGYKYFVVTDANSYTKNVAYTTPITSNTTANVHSVGNYAYGNATTTTYGGQTYIHAKPSSSNTIICFREKPKNSFSYNARFIYKSITKKYDI